MKNKQKTKKTLRGYFNKPANRQTGKQANQKGMTTMEYAVLIAAIFLALFAMQTTLRRAVSSRWKDAADSFGSGRQYEEGVSMVIK